MAPARDIRQAGQWWSIFADQRLDALIAAAHVANPSIEQAIAVVARTRAQSDTIAAGRLPQITAGAGATRQSGPLINAAGGAGPLYTSSASMAYELDLLGRNTRSRKAARSDVRASEAQAEAARLMVEASVAQAYFEIVFLDAEAGVTDAAAKAGEQRLALIEDNGRAGLISATGVDRARVELAAIRSDRTTLSRRRAEAESRLATLVGRPPEDFALPPHYQPSTLPAIPAGLPSAMLLRRPDLRAADFAISAAQDRLGSLRRSWFPMINLTASEGFASSSLSDLIRNGARATGLGLLVALPLFDGGRRDSQIKAAEAEARRLQAAYRETVLQSLREVEDQLVALRTLGEQVTIENEAADAAGRIAERSDALRADGLISLPEAYDAEREALSRRRSALTIESRRYYATIALIRALGGGWS